MKMPMLRIQFCPSWFDAFLCRLSLNERVSLESVTEELWAMRLGLKLLQERARTGSFWWPYIGNLPEAFDIPIFFSGDDIKNLHYAPLIHQVNKRCRFLLSFEKDVRSMLEGIDSGDHPFSGQCVDASSVGWAMSAVSSRAFRLSGEVVQDGSNAGVPMLLPLIDMCNHSFNPNAFILQERNVPEYLVEVISETSIDNNAPVTLNYGSLTNDLFLLDYGFVETSNKHDNVELKYDGVLLDAAATATGVSDPCFSSPSEWQRDILSQLGFIGDGASLKINLGGEERVDGRLLAALRVLFSNNQEAAQKSSLKVLMSFSAGAPLGESAEISALRTIIALCVICLQQFPTKIMDDEAILKGNISDATRLVVQFRLQKKLMIVDLMQTITKRVKVLLQK
ncbi:rubisco methyltransferase family protein isoform X2 [Wolffia australiana]